MNHWSDFSRLWSHGLETIKNLADSVALGGEEVFGAIVLCGGKSLRMGQSKDWLPFGPELLLQRAVRIVSEVAQSVVVVTAPDQRCPPLEPEVRIVQDALPGRGPLEGFAAGLRALPSAVQIAFITSTDAPFLMPALIRFLCEQLRCEPTQGAAVPFVAGFPQPLAAAYRKEEVLEVVEAQMVRDQRRLMDLLEQIPILSVPESQLRAFDPALASFRNLNTRDDYLQALRDAGLTTENLNE